MPALLKQLEMMFDQPEISLHPHALTLFAATVKTAVTFSIFHLIVTGKGGGNPST